ncbi:MAG TPA: undecaprenyl diphosphate synthase family protein, partial [Gaiellales bacterium]
VPASEVDEQALRDRLYEPRLPDPDLVIRSSGENRVSNFLLFQIAYAELVFADALWPDFGRDELAAALHEYARRRRRFGGR